METDQTTQQQDNNDTNTQIKAEAMAEDTTPVAEVPSEATSEVKVEAKAEEAPQAATEEAPTTGGGVKRGIDEVGGEADDAAAKKAKLEEDGQGQGRRAPWQRSNPHVTPEDSPRNHLCKKLKTLLKARRPQDLDCQCECAHHPSELVPTLQHTLLPPGSRVTCSLVHPGQLEMAGSTYVIFPSEQIFKTKGTADIMPQTTKNTVEHRPTRRLCKHYVKWGSCDLWHECPYVHMVCADENALTLPSGELYSALPWRIEAPKQTMCEKWLAAWKAKQEEGDAATATIDVKCECENAHGWEELEAPNTHILLPPTDHLPVREVGSTGLTAPTKTYPSEQVFYTDGAWGSLKEHRNRTGQTAVPRQHCADFIRYQKCTKWDKCDNVHVLNLETYRATASPAVRPSARTVSSGVTGGVPPGPIGPDGELRIPRMSTEERRANWPKSILCHRSPCACPCAHSIEELREPPNHYRLPAGCKLRVKTQDGSAMHEYESDQCFLTVGSLPAYQAGMRGETLLRTHCMHFMRLQRCPHWENCQYIHVSHTRGISAQPTAQPTAQATPTASAAPQKGNGKGGYGGYRSPAVQANAAQNAYQTMGGAAQGYGGMQAVQAMQRQGQMAYQPQQVAQMAAMQPTAYQYQYGAMDPTQQAALGLGYATAYGNAATAYGAQPGAAVGYVAGQQMVMPGVTGSYVQPQTAVTQQAGVQATGTGKDTMCPNWKSGIPCSCTRAHGWGELIEPPTHALMSTQQSKIAIVAEGHPPQIYPCQQIYQTTGALDLLQGRRTELRHCVDYLRHQKCERWAECPDAHVWRPPQ